MILIDLSQVMMATIFENSKYGLEKNLAKSMIYVTLLSYKKKFYSKYGAPVLCADSRDGYWRRDVFEHYKGQRKKARQDSGHDWELIFEIMNEMHEELSTCCPWKYVRVSKAEADDVIGALAMRYGDEPTLIISSDKDFKQLQVKPGVEQFSPYTKKYIKVDNPKKELQRLIIEGDASDGIPNIFSDSDTFMVEGKRQKPFSKKLKELFEEDAGRLYQAHKERYLENQQLIDLSFMPSDILENIHETFEKPIEGNINKLYKIFVANRMNRILSDIEIFKVKETDYGICTEGSFFQ